MKAWIEAERIGDNLNLIPYAQTCDGSTQHLTYSFEVSQSGSSGGTSQTQQSGTADAGPEPTLLSNAALYVYPGSQIVATLRLYQGSASAPVKQTVWAFPAPSG